ncbi:MAG TPA: FAD-dependent oxidoreductase, partial [Pyrinomonadaceae bacterium]|nr:FAD-dependent oxidoreductase [Pyrinomonadaceae bacterium]
MKPSPTTTKQGRREFLKAAGLAAAGAPIYFSPFVQRQRYSCVVIGAGLAGLAAANVLKDANWEVTVLEARERTGGRVFSYSFKENPDLICELGAEWIGENHERMKGLCKDFKIPLLDHRFDTWLMRDGVVKQPGHWDFSPKAQAAFEKLKKAFKDSPESFRRMDK